MKKKHLFAYGILSIFPGIPAGVLLGYFFFPMGSLPEALRMGVHGFAILTSYPLYIMGVFQIRNNITQAMMLISSGVVFRMMGLMIVGILMMLIFKAYLKSGMLIYFISIATFLIFELVSVVGLYIYAFKR